MLPILLFLALAASPVMPAKVVLIDAQETPIPPVVNLPRLNHLFINGPTRRGTLSLRNGKMVHGDDLKLALNFDPINRHVYANASVSTFSLHGDYGANLEMYDEAGDPTVLHGKGFLNLTYTDFNLWDAKFDLKYNPTQKKYQLCYPSYNYEIGSIGGEITGMVNAKTKEPISFQDFLKSNRNRLWIMDLYLALANKFSKRKYAVNVASDLVNSFVVV